MNFVLKDQSFALPHLNYPLLNNSIDARIAWKIYSEVY